MDADETSQEETITSETADMVKLVEQDLEQHARKFVQIFAEGWHAPRSADELVKHFTPWLTNDFRFTQPFLRGEGVGHAQFAERFARPLFAILRNVHATVDSWASAGDTVFIALTVTCTVGRHRVAFRGCDRLRLVDGKAAERHNYADLSPVLIALLRSPGLWPRAICLAPVLYH
ncbi:nuclear transport factor 2 family protein [uncultured Corynebacterium sp.]|uniref:nuclear transport factor 2 family protein n=1 Tax=uncultured Corynebacterium sp. TaxID=159447 RepID=UPI00259651E5|nr:nuclear transport factor 2 family protein [uncultured Corynebacterium sp.]